LKYKQTKITLILSVALIAVTLSGCVQETPYEEVPIGGKIAGGIYDISDEELEKMPTMTDPVIAHIPLRADIYFHRPPRLNRTVNITYILTPSTDLRVNVSDGIVLPEGIVFVENDMPTDYITLSKNKTYLFNSTIRTVKLGNWTIYASPGVYAEVLAKNDKTAHIFIQKVFRDTLPIIHFRNREDRVKVSEEQQDVLMTAANDWLSAYGAQEYEKAEFNCSRISGNEDVLCYCYGCEMMCYSDSTLVDRYYFVIEEGLHTREIKIRNVYRWTYSSPSGYQSDPVCEEIRIENTRQRGWMVEGNVVIGKDGKIIGRIIGTDDGGTLFVPAK